MVSRCCNLYKVVSLTPTCDKPAIAKSRHTYVRVGVGLVLVIENFLLLGVALEGTLVLEYFDSAGRLGLAVSKLTVTHRKTLAVGNHCVLEGIMGPVPVTRGQVVPHCDQHPAEVGEHETKCCVANECC